MDHKDGLSNNAVSLISLNTRKQNKQVMMQFVIAHLPSTHPLALHSPWWPDYGKGPDLCDIPTDNIMDMIKKSSASDL